MIGTGLSERVEDCLVRRESRGKGVARDADVAGRDVEGTGRDVEGIGRVVRDGIVDVGLDPARREAGIGALGVGTIGRDVRKVAAGFVIAGVETALGRLNIGSSRSSSSSTISYSFGVTHTRGDLPSISCR